MLPLKTLTLSFYTVYDYEFISTTQRVYAGGPFLNPTFFLESYEDGVSERREGYVVFLEIIESELDPRDVGNVSLSQSTYLIAIDESG